MSITTPARLLIAWHSRTGAARTLAARAAAAAGPACAALAADDVTPNTMLAFQGYLFVCPENLGAMTGAMKELFDRCYYPLLGRIEGRPYATIVTAGSDGRGAQAQLDRIVTGWRLRRVAPPLIVNLMAQTPAEILAPKQPDAAALLAAADLGQAIQQGLHDGIF